MPLARLLAFAAALLLGAAALPQSAGAQNPVFTVSGVEVDVTGDSAAAARQQAIDNGHRKAFQQLMQRLVPSNRVSQVPELSAQQLANYVRDFEVFDERTSDVRYLASLTFRFQPQAVRQFLRSNEIPFAETRSKPVVVLPVYGSRETAVLWEEPNPWREVWSQRTQQTGLVPLTVPLGDLSDIRAIDVQQALETDEAALQQLAQHHGADDVVVTQARVAGDPEAGTASLQVISTRVGTPSLERTLVDNVQQEVDEDLKGMLTRAADGVVRDIEESWKRANVLSFNDRQALSVEVPLDGIERWVAVRDRLDGVARVAGVSIDLLSRAQARLQLDYYGEVEQLQVALRQQDLVLERIGQKQEREREDRGQSARRTPSVAGVEAAGVERGPNWHLRPADMTMAQPQPAAQAEQGPDAAGTSGPQSARDEAARDAGMTGQSGTSESDAPDSDPSGSGVPAGADVRELRPPEQAGSGQGASSGGGAESE